MSAIGSATNGSARNGAGERVAEDDRQMPCGCCAPGIYAPEAVRAGVEMFGACATRRDALKAAPRCQHDETKICMGARDFIVAMSWPIDRAAVLAEIGP